MRLIEQLAAGGARVCRCTSRSITSSSRSGLIEHYKKEKGDRGEGRVENL